MMKKKYLLNLTALASISLIIPTKYAHAWATSGDVINSTNQVNRVTKETARDTQRSIEDSAAQIIAALQNVSKQNTENTVSQENSEANMRDVQDQRTYAMAVQKEKLAAYNDTTSGASVCGTITGAAASQHLDTLVSAWRSNAVQAVLAHNAGHIDGVKAVQTPDVLRRIYNQGHCNASSTAEDAALGRCGKGSSPTQSGSISSLDSNEVVTTADDQNADLFLNHEVLDDNQQGAMGRFLVLTTDPHPPGQSVLPNYNSTADKERMFYDLDSLRALKSIGSSVISGLIAETAVIKTAGGQTQNVATNWANNLAKYTAGYNADSSGSVFPNGVSALAIEGLVSKYWYYNLQYALQASSEGEAASLKDLNSMMAWNTVLNYKKYLQMRQMNASLAGILSILVENRQDVLLHKNGNNANG